MKKLMIALFLISALGLSAQDQNLPDLFDPEHITQIEITFQESNWHQTMVEYKKNSDAAEKRCDHEYEDERLTARVVVNGVVFEGAGIKYKGNSTYGENNVKNPLNIELDYTNSDSEYQGHSKLKLSNIKSDPSFVREVLSYEILRSYMAGPRSKFAQVYINGNLYGLFTVSESIDKKFAKKHFGYKSPNALIKCNAANAMGGSGAPSLEYKSNDSSAYNCSYQVKSDYGLGQLSQMINTLNNNFQNVESALDIDRAIWMIAFNNVLVNLDSYSGQFQQNYYLIWDDTDRFSSVVWDLNMSFGSFNMAGGGGGGGFGGWGQSSPLGETDLFLHENDANFPLIQKILKNDRYRKMYVAHCKTIMNEYFENGLYKEKGSYWQNIIRNSINQQTDETNYQNIVTGFEQSAAGGMMGGNVVGITELMEQRKTYYGTKAEYTAQQPTIANINAPAETEAFQNITISAQISNANFAYIGYRNSSDEIFTKVEMTNNGNTWEATISIDEKNTHYYIYAENSQAGIFSPQRAEHEYYNIYGKTTYNIKQELVINEFLASNTMSETDETGEYEDWIEIYNNTDNDINLGDYYLTDNLKEPIKWQFPDSTIPARGYVIVWADENGSQGSMHANFKLSAEGEEIGLANSNYEIIDSVSFSNLFSDLTLARIPNGTGEFVIGNSTFGKNNTGEEPQLPIVQTIHLNKGWNLISFYVQPEENALEKILENTDYSIVKTLDQFFYKSYPVAFNTLKDLHPGVGYFVYMNKEATITLEGMPTENKSVLVNEGWNLIGIPSGKENISPSDITGNCSVRTIKNFDGSYTPNSWNNSLNQLENGKAYLLYSNGECSLEFE